MILPWRVILPFHFVNRLSELEEKLSSEQKIVSIKRPQKTEDGLLRECMSSEVEDANGINMGVTHRYFRGCYDNEICEKRRRKFRFLQNTTCCPALALTSCTGRVSAQAQPFCFGIWYATTERLFECSHT